MKTDNSKLLMVKTLFFYSELIFYVIKIVLR